MPQVKERLYFEAIRSRDSASFTGSYQTLGSVLANPSRFLMIVNNSGVLVTISLDGTNDHLVLQAGGALTFDEVANAVPYAQFCIAAGTQFYVKGSASTGLVYLSTAYAG